MLKYKYIPPHQRTGSLHATPEPSPRMSRTLNPRLMTPSAVSHHNDMYGSNMSLSSYRYSHLHGSMNSLASSSTPRRKKGKAPAPPPVATLDVSPLKSCASSPSHSVRGTPLLRKKRSAPVPPTPLAKVNNANETAGSTLYTTANTHLDDSSRTEEDASSAVGSSLNSTVLTSSLTSEYVSGGSAMQDDEMSTTTDGSTINNIHHTDDVQPQRKLIPLEASLLEDVKDYPVEATERDTEKTVYRRTIMPEHIPDGSPFRQHDIVDEHDLQIDSQCAKIKENKESQNHNRRSQNVMTPEASMMNSESIFTANKSSYGKWKRRKGPAPGLPVPPRKVLQMLPLQDIRHELDVIEVQQLGLEKQVDINLIFGFILFYWNYSFN